LINKTPLLEVYEPVPFSSSITKGEKWDPSRVPAGLKVERMPPLGKLEASVRPEGLSPGKPLNDSKFRMMTMLNRNESVVLFAVNPVMG